MRLRAARHSRTSQRRGKISNNWREKPRCRTLRDRHLITNRRSVWASLIVQCRDGYAARSVDKPVLGGDGLRLVLIRAAGIERRRDDCGVGRILESTVFAVPHTDIDGETDCTDQHAPSGRRRPLARRAPTQER